MYDNYSGTITIDGIDIRCLDKESIRGNITIISQLKNGAQNRLKRKRREEKLK